jgi:hypothetical protein
VRLSDQAIGRGERDAWTGVLAAYIDARPHVASVVDELAQIERLTTRQILSPFSLTQLADVTSADVNAAADHVSA